MRILKLLALLLHYPDEDLQQAAPALLEELPLKLQLNDQRQAQLRPFLQQLAVSDLLTLQQEYVDTFDRGRACALHLFEHVHGDSRDRGQAMVDLVEIYRQAGYAIDTAELPDYLPLFLEFLANSSREQARQWLQEIGHILKLLYVRLSDRRSSYARLFQVLLDTAGLTLQPQEADGLRSSGDDRSPAALDQAWAEEPVTFGLGSSACPSMLPQRPPFPVPRPLPQAAGE